MLDRDDLHGERVYERGASCQLTQCRALLESWLAVVVGISSTRDVWALSGLCGHLISLFEMSRLGGQRGKDEVSLSDCCVVLANAGECWRMLANAGESRCGKHTHAQSRTHQPPSSHSPPLALPVSSPAATGHGQDCRDRKRWHLPPSLAPIARRNATHQARSGRAPAVQSTAGLSHDGAAGGALGRLQSR
jgi:hypothetical protein